MIEVRLFNDENIYRMIEMRILYDRNVIYQVFKPQV